MKRWVLTYGAEAEVEKPERLRQMIATELKEAAKRYTGAALKGALAVSFVK